MDLVTDYFHFPCPKCKTGEYTQLRQAITVKYGYLLGCFLVIFLLCIPLQTYLATTGKWYVDRVHVLKSINTSLDSVIRRRSGNRLVKSLCVLLKNTAYSVYLNSTTLFQVALWIAVFTGFGLIDINNGDLIFLAKRLGRLCAVSLPTIFFLTLRPSPLPHTLYLSLLPIHKWISRAVVLLAILHTIIYLSFFQHNLTWPKAWKKDNLYGWAALGGFFMIAITSLLKVRDRAYKLFFFNHYFWSWVIVLALPFHIRPINTTWCNTANVVLLAYQCIYRVWNTRVSADNDFLVTNVSPNLAVIEFPNHLVTKRPINPGAHLRVTNYHPNPIIRIFKQLIPNYHPYTIVSLPLDRSLKLIVRNSTFSWQTGRRYLVFGSFDPKLLLIKSNNTPDTNFSISKLKVNAKKILIVIGGSAISFAIPILRVANYHGIPVKVIWVVRDFRDIAVLRSFEGYIHADDFEIFVTGSEFISDDFEATGLRNAPSLATLGLKNATSYGTFLSARHKSLDLETNEQSRLLDDELLNQEVENVDLDLTDEDEDEDCRDCTIQLMSPIVNDEALDDNLSHDDDLYFHVDEVNSLHSRRTSRSQSTNEQFIPQLDNENENHTYFSTAVKRLKLELHIYKGRPKLNYRYYNWCTNESDIFTQCSGPVLDDSSNLVCCKDLPGRQHAMAGDRKLPDLGKVWVISAGPKSLVKKTKLWASENGLKFHEEAFYV